MRNTYHQHVAHKLYNPPKAGQVAREAMADVRLHHTGEIGGNTAILMDTVQCHLPAKSHGMRSLERKESARRGQARNAAPWLHCTLLNLMHCQPNDSALKQGAHTVALRPDEHMGERLNTWL